MDESMGLSRPLAWAYQELSSGYLGLVDALSLMRAVSNIDVRNLSERELLASALRALVLNQDLACCSVYLLRDGVLHNAAGLDWGDLVGNTACPRGKPLTFRLGEGLVGLAAQSGELQHCRNCASDPRYLRQDGSEGSIGSVLAVPIRTHGELLGVLNVSHPRAESFTPDHERVLQIFGNFLGQMLVTRRLLEGMEQLVLERTEHLETALAEAQEMKRRYAELSVVDELTGLHNRRHFFPAARAAIAHALRYGSPLSLILIDIDHFKPINDTWGHGVGDEVLRRFSRLLRLQCRESDLLARFGGEEFILALPETDLDGARRLAERIRLAVRALKVSAGDHPVTLTASLGLAYLAPGEPGGESEPVLERLIREADQALYFGKHNGRDQCRYYPDIACFL